MIEVRNLKCEFKNGSETQVLFENATFKINKGDFAMITGPSGSGKTTLLKIISGVLKPTEGKVFINGCDLYSLSKNDLCDYRLKNSGFVYQDFMLIDELNAYDNIILPQKMARINDDKYIDEIVSLLKIESLLKKYPAILSGGEKQKIAIARSLVNHPSIIFCDEPTGSLDFKSTSNVMELLKKLNEELNVTIVMVTHELELLQYANRIIRYVNGKIVCE